MSVSEEDALKHKAAMRAQFVIDDLCADPEVWLTHGCPGIGKLDRIQKRIEAEIIKSLNDERL